MTNAESETFIYDIKDGVRGYNTDPARGADTFHPFNSAQVLKTLNFTGPQQNQTIDCTHISGYKNLTVDNFYYKMPNGKNYSASADGSGKISATLVCPTLTYNNGTGILTVNNGYAQAAAYQYGVAKTYVDSITVIYVAID